MMQNILKTFCRYWWLAAAFMFALCLIALRIPDSDTFFLAATGRYIVENNIVPTINPFVIHEGFGIIVQQWLFDVLIYGIYEKFGNEGILCFLTITYTISLTLLYKYFGLFTNNNKHKNIVVAISGFLLISFTTARPTSTTFIVMLTLLYCMEQYRRTGKNRFLLPLPFLSLLEINMHAAIWPIMFVLIVPYIFPYTLPKKTNIKNNCIKWFKKNKYILLIMLIMFAVGFINPNGLKGMTYVMQSYGSATTGIEINELQPITVNSFSGIVIIITAIALAFYVYQNKEKLRNEDYDMQYEFTKFYMIAGVLILACMHKRNIWYLIIGATPVILIVWKNIQFKIKAKKELSKASLVIRSLTYFIILMIVSIFPFSTISEERYSTDTNQDSRLAPYKALEYLDEKEKQEITLYTEFNNGAFMEWNDYQVYLDARPELFQANINGKENIYTEFCNVTNGSIDYNDFLEKYQFTHLIVSKYTVFDMFLSLNDGYEQVVDGNGYTLYERTEI